MDDQHESCQTCGRRYYRNYDGTMRQHVCIPLPPPHSRTVVLRSGGTVTLSGTFDLLTLGKAERQLMSALLDSVSAYETSEQPETVGAVARPDGVSTE